MTLLDQLEWIRALLDTVQQGETPSRDELRRAIKQLDRWEEEIGFLIAKLLPLIH